MAWWLGGLAWLGGLVLYLNIVARHIKRFKTAVAMEFAHRDCDWFNLIVLLITIYKNIMRSAIPTFSCYGD